MIRGVDNAGCLILGLTYADLERLRNGDRVCSNARPPDAPGPHLCLYAAATDEGLLDAVAAKYPAAPQPPIADHRGDPELFSHPAPEREGDS
jgi:hypothetical protein